MMKTIKFFGEEPKNNDIDILEALSDIEDFIRDFTFEDFDNDKKTQNAVIRSL